MNYLNELHYLPSIAYFSTLTGCDTLIIEKHEYYNKQTFRNRCHINTAQGLCTLIIPLTSKHTSTLITGVRIDYPQKWLNNHWRAIESGYRNAPYFEHYAAELHKVLFRKYTFLYDLNFELLTICLNWLNFNISLKESVTYEKTPGTGIQDFRNLIHPKKPELLSKFFRATQYQQVFGKSFVENLSIIDLVFCEGPNARNILRTSAAPPEQIK